MDGTWRKDDRSLSNSSSSRRHRRRTNRCQKKRSRSLRKSDESRKRRRICSKSDDDDDFAFRGAKRRLNQSHHHRSIGKASFSRRYPSDSQDSRRCRKTTPQSRLKLKRNASPNRRSSSFSRNRSYEPNIHKRPSPVNHRRKYEENPSAQYMEEKNLRSRLENFSRLNYFYKKSGKNLLEGRLKKALKYINICIPLCNDKNLSKLYTRRGTIHSLIEKPRCSFQGFLDWEHAYIIDQENMEARKMMSKALFMGANKMFREKKYAQAFIPCNHALQLYKGNGEAFILSKLLKKKIEEKNLQKQSASRTKEVTLPSTSSAKCNSERMLDAERQEAVLEEVKRLNTLIAEAVKSSDFFLALMYVNVAIRLYKSDIPLDILYRQLLTMKKNILKNLPSK